MMRVIWNDFLSALALQAFDTYSIWLIASSASGQHGVALFGSVQVLSLLFTTFGGVMTDTHSRVFILKVCSVIRVLAIIVLATLYSFSSEVWLLILLGAISSIVSAFYDPAIETIAPFFSKDENELVNNNSKINMVQQISSIAGAGLSGVLILIGSLKISYLILSTLMLISAVLMVGIKNEKSRALKQAVAKESLIQKAVQTANIPIIKVLVPYAIFLNLFFWLYWYLTPTYLEKYLPEIKVAYSVQSITVSVAAFLAGYLLIKIENKKNYFDNYVNYLVLQGLGIVIVPLGFLIFDNEWVRLACLVVGWASYGIFNLLSGTVFITILQEKIDDNSLGIAFGTIYTIFGLVSPLASAISGIFDKVNLVEMLIISLPILIVPLVMLLDKRIKKLINKKMV